MWYGEKCTVCITNLSLIRPGSSKKNLEILKALQIKKVWSKKNWKKSYAYLRIYSFKWYHSQLTKVVYIHQFKVMAKAVQKIEVIFVWAKNCGVALMTRTLYHRYISGRSGGVYTLPPPWRPSPIGPVPALRGQLRRTQELRSSAKDTHVVWSLYKLYSRVKTAGGLVGVYTYEFLAQLFLTSKIRGFSYVYQALLRSCGSQ